MRGKKSFLAKQSKNKDICKHINPPFKNSSLFSLFYFPLPSMIMKQAFFRSVPHKTIIKISGL
jgi:hypothetical protein